MPKAIDITGKKFFKLTAIKFVRKDKRGSHYWLFRCDCGKEKVIRKSHILEKMTKSCGCHHKAFLVTHDMSTTRFYRIWNNIVYRCISPNAIRWEQYGGRGIKCEWKSFEDFRDDMYESYLEHCQSHGEKNTSINRIDNDGNYFKDNCEWEIAKNQARNRKTNRIIEWKGFKRTVMEWSEKTGIDRHNIEGRLQHGWSISKALTQKVRSHK